MSHDIILAIRDVLVAIVLGYFKLRLDSLRRAQKEHAEKLARCSCESCRYYTNAGNTAKGKANGVDKDTDATDDSGIKSGGGVRD